MDSLKERIETILTEYLPGAAVTLEYIPQAEKLGGEIVWSGFTGMAQTKRHRHLRSILREHLTPAEDAQLSAFLTFSPAEMAALVAYA